MSRWRLPDPDRRSLRPLGRRVFLRSLLCVFAVVPLGPRLRAAPPVAGDALALRVVILANRADPDSLRIARHYAQARGVPEANIVALALPVTETISWREFVTLLWEPLMEGLVREKWIDAIPMALTDSVGRTKFAPYGHRIAALVVCRGVPLKVAHEAALFVDSPPFTARNEFRTNAGAIDAELSQLARPNYPINAFISNPLFHRDRPTAAELGQVVKVSRLDGPTPADALALVDRALEAERTGLIGRAYVDISNRNKTGDDWLESAARQLTELGFDLSIDRAPATFAADARIDAPALYFGWYAGNLNGPFALPGFTFPPGAIALHIHSFSAGTLRSTTSGWTAPFIARGVTATVGNVHEPYLQFTHRPDLLLRALARGAALADAAYYSLNVLSWQAVLIGDPLYRPFAISLEDQLKNTETLPLRSAGYAVLRQMRLHETAGRDDDAKALAMATQRRTPSLAVAVALALRRRDAGDVEGAGDALGFVSLLKSFPTDEWSLAAEAARLLGACGRAPRSVALWRTLLTIGAVPRDLRIVWLRDAQIDAANAKDAPQARAWEEELTRLVAPEKK